MSRKGENIYHRKDGRWEGRFRIPGESGYHSVYAHSYTECRRIRNEQLAHYQPKTKVKKGFALVCEDWLCKKKSEVKESTYSKYEHTVRKHFMPYFSEKKLSLTAQQLREYIDYVVKTGLSPKTIREQFKLLKQIALFADSSVLTAFTEAAHYLPKIEKPKIKTMDENNRNRLETFVTTNMDTHKLGVYLAMSLGLRIGEVCALQWTDIDLSCGKLYVRKTLQRIKNIDRRPDEPKTKIVITTAKTAAGMREIPLPQKIVKILKTFKTDDNSYVLTGTQRFVEPRVFSKIYHKYLKKCGIQDTKFHVLRHTFATRFAEKVGDYKALAEILGHSTPTITMLYYVHPTMEYKRTAINLLL